MTLMNFLNLTRPESRVGPGVTGRPPVPASRRHGSAGGIWDPGPAAGGAGGVRRQSRAPSAGPAADAVPTRAHWHARHGLAPSPTARRGPAAQPARRGGGANLPVNLKLPSGTFLARPRAVPLPT